MKYILLSITILFLILLGIGTYCGSNLNRLAHSIVVGNEELFQKYYKDTQVCTRHIDSYRYIPNVFDGKHLVVLQNNYEIRPTGGFMGSYAIATFKNGVLKEWEIQDIYTADGQIEGHVSPLAPIQQAFKTGEWRLPNSNWDPDFEDSATDIIWFFEKAGVDNIDGVIAINFELIKNWVGIIGEVKPLDFDESLNKDNFYYLTQSYSQDNFFPGSHAKKNYLSSAGGSLITKTTESSPLTKLKLFNLIKKQLGEKQILIWHKDKEVMALIEKEGWSGSLGDYDNDYFYSVESNLGSNKSNYCVERSIKQDVLIDKLIDNKTTITFANDKDDCINTEVQKWMGEYMNYQRIIIPSSAIVKSIEVNGNSYTLNNDVDPDNPPDYRSDRTFSIDEDGKYKEVGFWIFVPVQGNSIAIINYTLPKTNNNSYSIYVKRQPGIYAIPYQLTVNDKPVVDFTLTQDEVFVTKL